MHSAPGDARSGDLLSATSALDRDSGGPTSRHAEDWMSAPRTVGLDPPYDTSVAHSARVYAYWIGGKDY